MARASLRNDILAAGLRVMFRRGYNGAGIRDIAADAAAPHGSFTNHFRSKEAFATEVLDRYFDDVKRMLGDALGDERLSCPQRLRRYLDVVTERLEADAFTRGCLIGDFSIETAQASEMLRNRLLEIYREWRDLFADCIAAGQVAGEIGTAFTPGDLADFLIASWEGAILCMKVERTPAPLERFKRIAFATIFTTGS